MPGTMQSRSNAVDNIDLEDKDLTEAIENYNATLPKGQTRLKVMKRPHEIPADSATGTETTM